MHIFNKQQPQIFWWCHTIRESTMWWWCNRTPVREVCPNYEVVLFQPRTVNPPYLGYVDYCYTFKLGLPPHLFLLLFYGFFVSPRFLTSSPSIYVHRLSPLVFTRSPLPLPVRSAAHRESLVEEFLKTKKLNWQSHPEQYPFVHHTIKYLQAYHIVLVIK